MQFKNPAGEQMNLDEARKLDAWFDIINFWKFPEGFGLKAKVGQFALDVSQNQQYFVSEEMIEWNAGFSEVSMTKSS